MESILIPVAVIVAVVAVLVAVVSRSRRGQSSIGRGSRDTVYEKRRREQGKGTWKGPGICRVGSPPGRVAIARLPMAGAASNPESATPTRDVRLPS
jgi:hypothetical protein